MAQQSVGLLEVMVLLQELYRDALAQVVGLEFGIADEAAIDLAEAVLIDQAKELQKEVERAVKLIDSK